jgi:hypothetical protein
MWKQLQQPRHCYLKTRPREVAQTTFPTSRLLAHRVAGVGVVTFLHPLHERRPHLLRHP